MVQAAQWKQESVKSLVDAMSKSSVIALVNVDGIPGPQLQKMRSNLRGKVNFIVSKQKLIDLALQDLSQNKPKIEDLSEELSGHVGIIATNENPFKLYKQMAATMTPSPAKGGETAPDDIKVAAGETPFPAGPIVGELQKAGIPAAIEKGKVVIKKDKVLVKAGEEIPVAVAKMLTKLEILPLTVGLNLRAAYEGGVIYPQSILDVDMDAFMGQLQSAGAGAFNLAFNTRFPTSLTTVPLVSKAHNEALNLAMFINFPTTLTIDSILAKAGTQALSLAARLSPEALDEELQGKVAGAAAVAASAPAAEEASQEAAAEDRKDDDEDDGASEEDAAAGLGALFG